MNTLKLSNLDPVSNSNQLTKIEQKEVKEGDFKSFLRDAATDLIEGDAKSARTREQFIENIGKGLSLNPLDGASNLSFDSSVKLTPFGS